MPPTTQILVIEDDPDVARVLRKSLERDGYDVVWKSHGADGVAFARDHHPHLIILDVRLPDGSGFDFCRQMRQLQLKQPIIMLTVPLSMIGALLALQFTGNSLNVYSQIGLVTLVGLISKNGILITEFANQLQEAGNAKMEAIVEASILRPLRTKR